MYVVLGTSEYTEISNLTFAPQTDVTGSSVPVNQFGVDVHTTDQIAASVRASLYDDLDNLWAKYWVVSVERIDADTVHVRAQSAVKQLERDMLDPVMYDSDDIDDVLEVVLGRLDGEYALDSSLANVQVSGFCPQQTARNRFQWLCLSIGAYVKDFFGDKLEILPVDDDIADVIPVSDTYWRPRLSYDDYVTGARVYYYSYVEQEPLVTDRWVEASGSHYVETETQMTLRNEDAPVNALEHIVTVQGVSLLNSSNAASVVSNLAKYHFNRMRVTLDAINNFRYVPGQRLAFSTDGAGMYAGYLNSCTFTFGTQAKAMMEFNPIDSIEADRLTVFYLFAGVQVAVRSYLFPIGYGYEVENPYIDTWLYGRRYVFRPESETVSGTMVDGGVIEEVEVFEALSYRDGELHVVSVDGYEMTEGIDGENVLEVE